jgi:hypothetical protein
VCEPGCELTLDLSKSILYASGMLKESQTKQARGVAILTKLMGNPFLRFFVAGLVAIVVTTCLLLLMRFLIMGYDKSATEAMTQYFTLKTIVLTDGEEDKRLRVERPGERPELPGLDEFDFVQSSSILEDESSVDAPAISSPQQDIEKDFQLPQLETEVMSVQEKLQQIKQEILADDE